MDSPFDGGDIPTALNTKSTVSSMARSTMDCMTNIGVASAVGSARKLITPEGNAPADITIEATECLKLGKTVPIHHD